jgi:hypothetical protein
LDLGEKHAPWQQQQLQQPATINVKTGPRYHVQLLLLKRRVRTFFCAAAASSSAFFAAAASAACNNQRQNGPAISRAVVAAAAACAHLFLRCGSFLLRHLCSSSFSSLQ